MTRGKDLAEQLEREARSVEQQLEPIRRVRRLVAGALAIAVIGAMSFIPTDSFVIGLMFAAIGILSIISLANLTQSADILGLQPNALRGLLVRKQIKCGDFISFCLEAPAMGPFSSHVLGEVVSFDGEYGRARLLRYPVGMPPSSGSEVVVDFYRNADTNEGPPTLIFPSRPPIAK